MQFVDGNRIDLTLIPVDHIADMAENSLSVLLVDKDDRFDLFPPPNEKVTYPSHPQEKLMPIAATNFGGWRPMSSKAW